MRDNWYVEDKAIEDAAAIGHERPMKTNHSHNCPITAKWA